MKARELKHGTRVTIGGIPVTVDCVSDTTWNGSPALMVDSHVGSGRRASRIQFTLWPNDDVDEVIVTR